MLLSVENLWVFYGPIEALHDVSINVNEGEIVSIIGHNGAGKSTLLKSISCLLKPTSGRSFTMARPSTALTPTRS